MQLNPPKMKYLKPKPKPFGANPIKGEEDMKKERQIEILKGRINQCRLEMKDMRSGCSANMLHCGMIKAYEDAIRIIEGRL